MQASSISVSYTHLAVGFGVFEKFGDASPLQTEVRVVGQQGVEGQMCIRDSVGTDPEGYAKDSWGKVSFCADAVRRTVYLLGWNNDFLLYGFDGK